MPIGGPLRAIHFKEDVLRVKRSQFRGVILSESEGSLPGESDPSLSLRMTKRDGLFFEMYWAQGSIHFNEDVLQVNRIRFRSVILSESEGSLYGEPDPSPRSG